MVRPILLVAAVAILAVSVTLVIAIFTVVIVLHNISRQHSRPEVLLVQHETAIFRC